MIVQVRSITSRPVRRRGMKPPLTAVVADPTGTMEAPFFNQPWLQPNYAPGAPLRFHDFVNQVVDIGPSRFRQCCVEPR